MLETSNDVSGRESIDHCSRQKAGCCGVRVSSIWRLHAGEVLRAQVQHTEATS